MVLPDGGGLKQPFNAWKEELKTHSGIKSMMTFGKSSVAEQRKAAYVDRQAISPLASYDAAKVSDMVGVLLGPSFKASASTISHW